MNFYLLYGSDKALINREINDIIKKIGITFDDVIKYDLSDIDGILDEAMTISMFSDKKVLLIDATSFLVSKDNILGIERLENYFSSYNSNSYLIFFANGEIDSRRKLVKLISGKGKVSKLEATREYLSNYVRDYILNNGYEISNIDISTFLNLAGDNIDNITNELDKLMLYKSDDKVINKDDIVSLVSDSFDNSIYDLVSAILKNDKVNAEKLYNKFILNGVDASSITALLGSQIRLLFQVKKLYGQGKSNEEIAKILDIKNVYRVKYLINDSYMYSERDLINYLSKLAILDKNIKIGNCDGNVFLELFIINKDM